MIPLYLAGPAVEPVGVPEMRAFLRLEHDDFDGSLSAVKRRCAALRRARATAPEDVAIRVETAHALSSKGWMSKGLDAHGAKSEMKDPLPPKGPILNSRQTEII